MSRARLAIIIEVGSSWPHTQRCLETLRSAVDTGRDRVIALLPSGSASTLASVAVPAPDSNGLEATKIPVVAPAWHDLRSRLKLYPWVSIVDAEVSGDIDADHAPPAHGRLLNNAIASLDMSAYDLLLILDSSTLIDAIALRHIIKVFDDPQVGAAGPLSNDAEGQQLLSDTAYDPGDAASLRNFSRNWGASHGGETVATGWLDDNLVAIRVAALHGEQPGCNPTPSDATLSSTSAANTPAGTSTPTTASTATTAMSFNEQLHDPVYVKEDLLKRIARSGWQFQIAKGAFVHHESADYRLPLAADRELFFDIHGEYPISAPPLLVSACLITKNEESNLPDCLRSLKGFADEVVVYDTGSTDRTIEIATTHDATVIEGYWNDDFSRARNAAREGCKGQWILWIDADERLSCNDPVAARQALAEMPSNIEGCLIHIDNLEGTGVSSAFTHPACRMFRRTRCHWHGRLHEQISLVDKTAERAPFLVPLSKIRLLHVGYLDEAIRNRSKPERNLALAVEEMEETEGRDESYLKISLARSKTMTGNTKEMEEAVEVSLEAAEDATDPTTRRLGIRTAVEALVALGKLDEALEQIEVLRGCSSNPITADTLEARIRLLKGEPEVTIALLESVGSREVDDDMFEYRATQFAGMKASALAAVGRYSEAADMLLATLAEEGTLDAHLGDLLDALERAGRSPREIAEVLKKGKSLVAFMAQIAQLPAEKADAILDACYVRWGNSSDHGVPSEVMATAAIVARHLELARALEWAVRIRGMGIIPQEDILLARSRRFDLPLLEKALAAASCIYAFEDPESYIALRSVIEEAGSVVTLETDGGDASSDTGKGSSIGGRTEGYDGSDVGSKILQEIVARVEALLPGVVYKALLEVSIVVYCHNDADATGRCLTAIQRNCKPGSYEVILVDDASTDSIRELTVPAGSRLRMHRNVEHLGTSQSYRLGSQLADAPYIILMDNHSVLASGQIDALTQIMKGQSRESGAGKHSVITIAEDGGYNSLDSLPSGTDLGAFRRDVFPMVDWSRLEKSAPRDDVQIHGMPSATRVDATHYGADIRKDDTQESNALTVHVMGPLGIASGLGKAARLVAEASSAAGFTTSSTAIDTLERSLQVCLTMPSLSLGQKINDHHIDVISMNPDQLGHLTKKGIPIGCNDVYRVAMWNWEMENPPKETADVLGGMDEIWVLSDFEYRVFRRAASSIPIHVFPYPLPFKSEPLFSRDSMGLPQGFLFLNIFDAFSTVSRKNPDGLIAAFTKAFSPGEGPMLVMKINNADKSSCLIRLRQLARGRDDIKFIVNEVYTDERIDSLVAAADCYISLHRSEGFGLPMADAMAWGKPVIATGYSGNLDFMDEQNSYLIPWRYTELEHDDGPYPKGAKWAEPDLDAAASLMRYVYEHQEEARAKGTLARESIRAAHSPETSATFLKERMAAIREGIHDGAPPDWNEHNDHATEESKPPQDTSQSERHGAPSSSWATGQMPPDTRQPLRAAGSLRHSQSIPISITGNKHASVPVPESANTTSTVPTPSQEIPGLARLQGIDLLPPGSNYRGSKIVFQTIRRVLDRSPFVCRQLTSNDTPQYDAMLLFMDPDAMPSFAVERGQDFFERYTICCFDWPLEELSANAIRGLRYVNEIWVTSEHAHRAVSNAVSKPVVKLPICAADVIEAAFASFPGNAVGDTVAQLGDSTVGNVAGLSSGCTSDALLLELGIDPARPYLLNVIDTRHPFEMTNAVGAIRAFSGMSFYPGLFSSPPVLVIVQTPGTFRSSQLALLEEATDGRDDIVIASQLDMNHIVTLMSRCSGYISLHRATGFDLPLLLATSFGIPTIATASPVGESWNTAGSFHPVPASEGTVPSGCWPYPEGASWTEPDIAEASSLIARVFNDIATLGPASDQEYREPAEIPGHKEGAVNGSTGVGRLRGLARTDAPLPENDLQSIVTSRIRFAHNAFERANRLAEIHGRQMTPHTPQIPAATSYIMDNNIDTPAYEEWIARFDTLDTVGRTALSRHLESTFPALATPSASVTPSMPATSPASVTPSTTDTAPLISVVMPTYDTAEQYLREAIESVTDQVYGNWELCIADDASSKPHVREILEEYASKDERIKLCLREENGHISAASNSALALASGDYIALLSHDDVLAPHALATVALEIHDHPDSIIIYSDKDMIDEKGKRFNPYFKCDFDPELILGQNYLTHLNVFKKETVDEIGGFREGFEGSQDWDLALRVLETAAPTQIRHIPHVLYHQRSHSLSVVSSSNIKPYAHDSAKRAVEEHLGRMGKKAEVILLPDIHAIRVRYEMPSMPLVSIIIPTRDGKLLQGCIKSLVQKTSYRPFEIIIVDNGSVKPHTLSYLSSLEIEEDIDGGIGNPERREQPSGIRVLHLDIPFNYSALNNAAASKAKGELLCLLNDDIEVVNSEWLTEMVRHALRPEVGAVGAKLLFPDGTIQHGGVILGLFRGTAAVHASRDVPAYSSGYFGRAALTQSFSAVEGACLLVKRELYSAMGGLDEEHLPVLFSDANLCLHLREAGYRTVWEPAAVLIHHESTTRDKNNDTREAARFTKEISWMQQRWSASMLDDPAYNPNLSLEELDIGLAWPPRVAPPWK